MNIGLGIGVYKRHDLEKIVIDHYKDQAKKYGFEIIIAGSEGNASKRLAKGCNYIEVENYPVTNKHNAILAKAKGMNLEGMVIMGSDDIVNDGYWDWIYTLSKDEECVYGLKDIYFYSTSEKDALYYWAGYRNGRQNAGAGRFYSKNVLDKMNWKLWEDGLNKGMDSSVDRGLIKKGIKSKSVTMEGINGFLVDIKHTRSITSHNILNLCTKVNYDIMAKQVKTKTTKKLQDKLMKPEKQVKEEMVKVPDTKWVNVILNKDGKKYKVGRELAITLITAKRAKLA